MIEGTRTQLRVASRPLRTPHCACKTNATERTSCNQETLYEQDGGSRFALHKEKHSANAEILVEQSDLVQLLCWRPCASHVHTKRRRANVLVENEIYKLKYSVVATHSQHYVPVWHFNRTHGRTALRTLDVTCK